MRSQKTFELEPITDFRKDWAEILCEQLKRKGHFINPEIEDLDKLCLKYFNLLKRSIVSKPRVLVTSKEFRFSKHSSGTKNIFKKAKSGGDLNPYLSKQIKNLDYNDSLLNDWGIHHFHLGKLKRGFGFADRTGSLLFARVTQDYFYVLNVFDHGSWTKIKLIEIIHKNWPESIDDFKLQGLRATQLSSSEEQISSFRKNGIGYFTQLSDGTIYAPIGGGYSLPPATISSDVRVTCNVYEQSVRDLERYVQDNIKIFKDYTLQRKVEFPPQPHFQLKLMEGKAYAFEVNTKIYHFLRDMPLQLLGQS
ncbi:hypothetical protein [cf. Phormidesmis sp. LEGE 11477]|uniref:hypothetical protein n=1 Tax=cf. Phormidesmis sp. LEGE 11477 TaxID=1828680 RepID=UPI00187F1A52|nr:hypothetical protein [cf. Phormidesmis sp. LEGE 11477]MBE9061625.1 hypothetical protein [cf. Phormidesmis sp. LEGE 11477]